MITKIAEFYHTQEIFMNFNCFLKSPLVQFRVKISMNITNSSETCSSYLAQIYRKYQVDECQINTLPKRQVNRGALRPSGF